MGEFLAETRMNFKDEFYQKLKLLVLPVYDPNFMLALVSATDADRHAGLD